MYRLLIALAALALPTCAIAQPLTPDESAAIDAAVTKVLAETGVPSAQVAVVRGDAIVLARAWGKASETIAEARPDMPYQVASNSKQFLAALLLLLEDEGKLSLGDKIARWLPDVTGADRITVRQLLNHTSGLQDNWPQDYSFAAMEHAVTPQAIVARWAHKPLDYEPGTRWQYSNTGWVVAGLIAERAGGKPLWRQFEERLFRPAGIAPISQDDAIGAGFAQGYQRYALGPVHPVKPSGRGWMWASGEFSMTAADLAKWNLARLRRTVLPAEDWDEMERPVRLSDGTSNGYGLGVYQRQVGGRWVIYHTGGAVGFLSRNSVWPDDKVAVTVVVNGDFAGAQTAISEKIAAIVLPPASQAKVDEPGRVEDAKDLLAALAAGAFPADRFTDNARYYFTPRALSDYQTSLAPLGPVTALEPLDPPGLRGGFVQRRFRLKYAGRTLTLSTFAEPGAAGRWEQFIVTPE